MDERSMERLLDERAIRQLLDRYCRAVDRLDEELLRSCYHQDSSDDHGVYQGPGIDFAAFALPVLAKAFESTMHMLGQSIIEFTDADVARAETYVIARHVRRDAEERFLESVGARYVDRVERRSGEWKLGDRVVVYEWSTVDRIASALPVERFRKGTRSREDPAYGGTAAS